MPSLIQTLLLGAALPLADFALGQTIEVGGETVEANEGTVAPAVATVPADSTASDYDYFGYETAQLTSEVIANLTDLHLSNISLFDFATSCSSSQAKRSAPSCRAFPGSDDWPSDVVWKVFDLLLGGALIKGTPLAAPCFNSWPELRDEETCEYIKERWHTPRFQVDSATSVSFPLFEGKNCMISDDPDGKCTQGGFPSYVVNATNAAQIQLAVNFARNANLRLVIKNKGHDFNAKSTGAGSLSIFTGSLRDVRYIPDAKIAAYSGPAFKIGGGVEVAALYEEADKLNLQIVGGIGRTVGLAGGYSLGGGHSPLMGLHGMASDQILSMEVVLPDGRFVTVDKDNHADLYWGLRGGGGCTFGVVVSIVVAAYPRVPVATLSYSLSTAAPDNNVSADAWWAGMRAFWDTFVPNADAGQYVYFRMTCETPDQPANCTFLMTTHWANNMTAEQLEDWNAPFFAKLADLGIPVIDPVYTGYPSVLAAFDGTFDPAAEGAGTATIHVSSRLFPRANWEDPELLDVTAAAIRSSLEAGGKMVAYNYRPAVNERTSQDNAVTPAWRRSIMFAMMANPNFGPDATAEEIAASGEKLVELSQIWRDVTPGAGSYLNEGDINEPDFQQSFYGESYERLSEIKKRYDPTGLFYTYNGVGSEDWEVTDQLAYYPTTNGRLCRRT